MTDVAAPAGQGRATAAIDGSDAAPPELSNRAALRVLVLGYGNPGRQDDGLGPALAAEIARAGLPGVTVCDNYQLVIEDALEVAAHDVVWFVDASLNGPEPFELREIAPANEIAFNSHAVKPEVILALADTYCGARPVAYLMGIRGYEFAFAEGLTERAGENLRAAAVHVAGAIGAAVGATP